LSCEDIFEIEEVFEVLVILIIADDFEGDLVLALLLLGGGVTGDETEADVLGSEMGTYPCMPTKLLGLSFSSSILLCNILQTSPNSSIYTNHSQKRRLRPTFEH
jgi:hypothetical protein